MDTSIKQLCSNFNTVSSIFHDDQVYKERLDLSSNMFNYMTYPKHDDIQNVKDYGYTPIGEFSIPTIRVRAFEPMITRFAGKVTAQINDTSLPITTDIFDRDRLNIQTSLPYCKNAYNPKNDEKGFVKVNSGGLGYIDNTSLTRLKGKDGSTFINFNMDDKALHNPIYPDSRFTDSRIKRSYTVPFDFRNYPSNILPPISSSCTEQSNDTLFLNLAFKNTQVVPTKITQNPVFLDQGGVDTHYTNEQTHDDTNKWKTV
jgi:hypothetical protein